MFSPGSRCGGAPGPRRRIAVIVHVVDNVVNDRYCGRQLIVSVDGGCDPGLRLVAEGVIGATAQQYPGQMAALGMEAIRQLADGGASPEVTEGLDFFNTGVALVTDTPVEGLDSISVAEGQEICWG